MQRTTGQQVRRRHAGLPRVVSLSESTWIPRRENGYVPSWRTLRSNWGMKPRWPRPLREPSTSSRPPTFPRNAGATISTRRADSRRNTPPRFAKSRRARHRCGARTRCRISWPRWNSSWACAQIPTLAQERARHRPRGGHDRRTHSLMQATYPNKTVPQLSIPLSPAQCDEDAPRPPQNILSRVKPAVVRKARPGAFWGLWEVLQHPIDDRW